jgi:hypothetical protein
MESLSQDKPGNWLGNLEIGIAYDFGPLLVGISGSGGTDLKFANERKQMFQRFFLSTNKIRLNNIIISPEVGIGKLQASYRFTKDGVNGSFDDFMSNTTNQIHTTHRSTALDLGIALKEYNNDSGKVSPYVRIGYKRGLGNEVWKISGAQATGGPVDHASNFYVQLLFDFLY